VILRIQCIDATFKLEQTKYKTQLTSCKHTIHVSFMAARRHRRVWPKNCCWVLGLVWAYALNPNFKSFIEQNKFITNVLPKIQQKYFYLRNGMLLLLMSRLIALVQQSHHLEKVDGQIKSQKGGTKESIVTRILIFCCATS
jgi:hypothetical protein